MPTLERRYLSANDIEVRRADKEPVTITGYAAVFNSFSEDLGGFREIIRPGAFQRSIAGGADVRALVDHDPAKILGRTKSGTLKVSEDTRGLRFEVTLPDTTAARDLLVSMERGDVSGCSFGFRVEKDGDLWRNEQGKAVRELHHVDVFDVSVVTYPAYTAADAQVSKRALDFMTAETAEPTDIYRERVRVRELAA
jgi:HK97 family phage prohead protease